MAWVYLILAGLFEIGWPIGLKLAGNENFRWVAQKTIPMGTAYGVWTGIGAVGAFVVGVVFYNDALTFMRTLGILLIISGVIVLKLASS